MKIAVFSPLPPAPTGVADYTQALLEALRSEAPDWGIEAFSEAVAGDWNRDVLPVYQIGNSPHHDFIYPLVFRRPGVLVLHDLVLHHSRLAHYLESPEVKRYREDMASVQKRDRARKRMKEYAAEVEAAYPREGASVAEVAIRMGGGRLLYAYPLYELLVRASKMTLVHSQTACGHVLERCPASAVRTVRMGIALPEPVAREEARRRLGLGKGFLMASFGLITPEKRIPAALRSVKRLLDEGLDVDYYLVGAAVSHFDPMAEARTLGIGNRVHVTGRVSEEDFRLYAFASDLCLNLRYPSAGETSATLLRVLSAGRAVAVTDQVHYQDIPDQVVAKVPLEGEEDGLYCDLVDLMRRTERRKRLEVEARRFVEQQHSVQGMARDYKNYLEEARDRPPPPEAHLPRHLIT